MDTRDVVFLRFCVGIFIILTLYGGGMIFVAVSGNTPLAVKMVSGFSAMFSGAVGLGAGYLLGRKGDA